MSNMHWEEGWAPVDEQAVLRGGQGLVVKVTRKADGVAGALKQLHDDNTTNTERRRRMAREVIALATVSGDGVPDVLDHNTSFVEDKDIPLYVVTRWIEGHTLQQATGGRPQDLETAIRIAKQLTHIVSRCHAAGVVHRDIKPDNIIVAAETDTPFLVDFGIAWRGAPEDNQEILTKIGQELGNRFLRLPEMSAGAEQRDTRSDLTFVVGVFFFLLTGCAPRTLVSGDGRPPHVVLIARFPETLRTLPQWRKVHSVFDVGFQPSINLRFESAAQLLQYLEGLEATYAHQPEDVPAYIRELEEYKTLRQAIDRTIDEVEGSLVSSLENLKRRLTALSNEYGFSTPGSLNLVQTGRVSRLHWRFHAKQNAEPVVDMYILMSLEGDNRSTVTIRYEGAGYDTNLQGRVLYSGLAADVARLNEELESSVRQDLFTVALQHLNKKIGDGK